MKNFFGTTQQQKDTHMYSLANDFIKVNILDYGCIIQELSLNTTNQWDDIVLGYDNINDYENKSPYFGCITGRTAGRIANAEFTLDNNKYQLAQNNGPNNLHGGVVGLDKRIWTVESYTKDEIVLTYFSPDGEEGFPGNVSFKTRYSLKENILVWEVTATTDQDTPINITNHTYFNLASGQHSVQDHLLMIDADYFYPVTTTQEIIGETSSVNLTPFDFREPKSVGQDLDQQHPQLVNGYGFDHCYVLNKSEFPVNIYDTQTKKGIQIKTNQDTCVFYSGNFLEPSLEPVTLLCPIKARTALCIETQAAPFGIKDIILKAGDTYQNYNEWHFYHKEN